MEQSTPRPRRSASAPVAPTKIVGELEQTITRPDGSVVVNRATMQEKPAKRPPHPYASFLVVSAETALRIAADLGKQMGQRDFRVLFHLIGVAEFGNFVPVSQGAIARALDMDPPAVNRALKKLVALGLLNLDGLSKNPGVPRRFHLSPSLVWKGSTFDLAQVHEQARKAADPVQVVRRRREAEQDAEPPRRTRTASAPDPVLCHLTLPLPLSPETTTLVPRDNTPPSQTLTQQHSTSPPLLTLGERTANRGRKKGAA